ncbi:hypothetical protein ABZY81_41670 [Streptomyces sp. NPDC006514]|uniref:hypothetical protein n=1 Tax=Streptomyces sp. NPDC006514 TaxID=3154308 RepID=UPI0033A2607D
MPGSDHPSSDKPDGVEPQPGGESRTTRMLLACGIQAALAGLADEAAHWLVQFAVWLYAFIVNHM